MDRNLLAEKHLLSLILARDPRTGDPISFETALADPEVIRSLVLAKEALRKLRKYGTSDRDESGRAGKPWTEKEEQQLRSGFVGGASLKDLQNAHGRTDEGILSRLVLLGLVKSRQEARQMFR